MRRLRTALVILSSGLIATLVIAELLARAYIPGPAITDRKEDGRYQGTYFEGKYFKHDPNLGYRPPVSTRMSAQMNIAGFKAYDVNYTTNKYGFRATESNTNSKLSFVFLGCGMTFGEGLEDDKTIAAQFSTALDKQYYVVNLGVNGYGPQHALRAVESGLVQEVAKGDVGAVYFETTPGHMVRSFVPPDWDLVGPRYKLSHFGKSVKYAGPQYSSFMAESIQWLSAHSRLFFLIRNYLQTKQQNDKATMLWLYLQIIKQIKVLVEQELQAEFQVVLWDEPFLVKGEDLTPYIIDFLKREEIDYSLTSEIFQTTDYSSFRIPYDGHPNAMANKLLGQYLADDWNENL